MAANANLEDVQPYLDSDSYDLLPIHRWDKKIDGQGRGKAPRDKQWLARNYEGGSIERWISKGGNVGVRLRKNQLVIDIDPKHADAEGRSAETLYGMLELELGIDLSDCPVVETGSGGWHVYTTKDPNVRIREKIEAFGGSIEFKTRGRQVLCAGCKHPNGRHYKWVRHGEAAPAPSELLAALKRPDPKPRDSGAEELTPSAIRACLDQIDPTDFREYDDWRNIMFSAHHASGGAAEVRELFVRWSTSDPEYAGARGDVEMMWDAATEDHAEGRTAASLFWYLTQAGGSIPVEVDMALFDDVELPGGADAATQAAGQQEEMIIFERDPKGKIKPWATSCYAAMHQCGMHIYYDQFADKVWLVDRTGYFRDRFPMLELQLNDKTLTCLGAVIQGHVGPWSGEPKKAALKSAVTWMAQENWRHPVRVHLEKLEWDGTRRMDTWLINASDLENTPYNRAVSRLFLYAAIARIYSPGCKFDNMIILEGPQGGYKSTLIRHLGGEWASEGLPPIKSAADKDVVDAMLGKWLIEIEELASMNKTDINVLKAFLSKTEDRVRRAYKELTEEFKRQCIFIGTTNESAYLRDITGNRRFLPIKVGRIDISKVPRDQLWAEALVEWKSNPRNEITLPPELWDAAHIEQEDRRVIDPWEDMLGEWLQKMSDEKLAVEEIFEECFHRPFRDVSSADMRRLALVMDRAGWVRCYKNLNGVKRRGYRRR